ncbi:MAG: hypothetical protein ABIP20_14925 [Chthoniobacteraceae bacterium]
MNFRALLFSLLAVTAIARGDGSAFDALRLIPKEVAKRLVRIEAREGTPSPERWYLLVYEPAEERGLREYVVADGRLVTSRTLSQFAETMKPEDIVGADAVKVDSTQIAKLAAAFAEANGAKAGMLNYELARDSMWNVPVWKVTVLDAVGDQLGILAVTATKGAVVSADGFEKLPPGIVIATPPPPAPPVQPPGKNQKPTSKRKR